MTKTTLQMLQGIINELQSSIKSIKMDINDLLICHEVVKTEVKELNGSIQTFIDASKNDLNGF